MTSLKDIAKEVGLSVSVVSRALNAAPDSNARVSQNTRQLVIETARKMGYRRNRNAEFMRRNKSAAIGVFIPEFSNSLMANLLFGIAESANEANFPVSICTGLSLKSYREFISSHCEQAASGIISYSARQFHLQEQENVLQEYCSQGGKLLILNDITEERFTTLSMDEIEGGRIAGRLLLRHSCSRYLCLWEPVSQDEDNRIGSLRAEGFFEVLKNKNARVEYCPYSECIAQLQKNKQEGNDPCGIFSGSDMLAIRIMQDARRKNLYVGKDYFLVGYDDLDMAQVIDPPLTTIAQPFRYEGRRAVEKLIRMIYGKPENNEIIAPRMICRETA